MVVDELYEVVVEEVVNSEVVVRFAEAESDVDENDVVVRLPELVVETVCNEVVLEL